MGCLFSTKRVVPEADVAPSDVPDSCELDLREEESIGIERSLDRDSEADIVVEGGCSCYGDDDASALDREARRGAPPLLAVAPSAKSVRFNLGRASPNRVSPAPDERPSPRLVSPEKENATTANVDRLVPRRLSPPSKFSITEVMPATEPQSRAYLPVKKLKEMRPKWDMDGHESPVGASEDKTGVLFDTISEESDIVGGDQIGERHEDGRRNNVSMEGLNDFVDVPLADGEVAERGEEDMGGRDGIAAGQYIIKDEQDVNEDWRDLDVGGKELNLDGRDDGVGETVVESESDHVNTAGGGVDPGQEPEHHANANFERYRCDENSMSVGSGQGQAERYLIGTHRDDKSPDDEINPERELKRGNDGETKDAYEKKSEVAHFLDDMLQEAMKRLEALKREEGGEVDGGEQTTLPGRREDELDFPERGGEEMDYPEGKGTKTNMPGREENETKHPGRADKETDLPESKDTKLPKGVNVETNLPEVWRADEQIFKTEIVEACETEGMVSRPYMAQMGDVDGSAAMKKKSVRATNGQGDGDEPQNLEKKHESNRRGPALFAERGSRSLDEDLRNFSECLVQDLIDQAVLYL